MRILSLNLGQFRNYASQEVTFRDANAHLFHGKNGSGKTNLLEAVSVLSLTRSCRGREDTDLVQWEKDFFRLKADVRSDAGETYRIEVVSEVAPRRRKGLFINDVKTDAVSYVGFLPTVTFLPQDLELFTGPPAERRRFLDQLLSQVSPEYMVSLSHYQKILQQRNALLKRIAAGNGTEDELDLWERELAEKGAAVTLARLELIGTLNLSFREELLGLQEDWATVVLTYERKTRETTLEGLARETRENLKATRTRDILLQSTGIGPHREDWQVFRDGRPLPAFASRGQERVCVLALLFLEVAYLELKRGEKPVVLLDDAFSELDDAHQNALLRTLSDYQVIMTGVRVPEEADNTALYVVDQGIVTS